MNYVCDFAASVTSNNMTRFFFSLMKTEFPACLCANVRRQFESLPGFSLSRTCYAHQRGLFTPAAAATDFLLQFMPKLRGTSIKLSRASNENPHSIRCRMVYGLYCAHAARKMYCSNIFSERFLRLFLFFCIFFFIRTSVYFSSEFFPQQIINDGHNPI